MTERKPLSCVSYDHIEVACLGHYKLLIEFLDGSALMAEARDTRTRYGEEFLVVVLDDGEARELPMRDLLAITPQSTGARFGWAVLAQTSS